MLGGLKKFARLGATGVQIVGGTYPLWQGVIDHAPSPFGTGDIQNIPAGIIYRGTGYDINSGQWNSGQLVTTVAVMGGSYVVGRLMKAFLK